jgi:hypothetical protein
LDAYEKRETLRMLKVRTYTYRDWHQVWPIIRAIVLEQETFVYDPAMIEEDARSMWVDVGKPQPDPYLLAARRLEVPPGECLVIEDSTSGVTAGLAAGMTSGASTGASPSARNVTIPRCRMRLTTSSTS